MKELLEAEYGEGDNLIGVYDEEETGEDDMIMSVLRDDNTLSEAAIEDGIMVRRTHVPLNNLADFDYESDRVK